MGRPPCCDKSNVKRGLWTAEEDAKILAHVSKHGTGNWTLVPKKAGLNRCGKSCRLRWTNYLRPDLNHNDFTPQEEDHIINLHQVFGSRWSLIAKQLPGRTDNDVKNYWNTKLRKKLSKMGIDPLTHKPFSQIFSEFGSLSAARLSLPEPYPGPPPASLAGGGLFQAPRLLFQPPIINAQDMIPTTTLRPRFFNEAATTAPSSTCSSTSSSLVTTDFDSCQQPFGGRAQTTLEWSDFLLHDDPYGQEREDDRSQGLFSPLSASESDDTVLGGHNNQSTRNNDHRLENASANNSFVDAILDRDSELRSSTAFPEFLDESLEYY